MNARGDVPTLPAKDLVPELADVMAESCAALAPGRAGCLQTLQSWTGSRLDAGERPTARSTRRGRPSWTPGGRDLAVAVLQPVLGPLTDELLKTLQSHLPDDASPQGSSLYGSGWYEYVDKDLRSILGLQEPRAAASPTRYCGGGDEEACAKALWQALDGATAVFWPPAAALPRRRDEGAHLVPAHSSRTRCAGTNRPTFQQVCSVRVASVALGDRDPR